MPITSSHFTDKDGNPDGGQTHGCGFTIAWQRGPMVKPDGSRDEPNGAFVEDIIEAARDRLLYYLSTKFNCPENHVAIDRLDRALGALRERTKGRQFRGVEGTHEV